MHSQKGLPNLLLKRERELRGWSQADLAEKVGTTQKIVSRWERGESKPLPYYRQKLVKVFGKDAAELGLIEQPQNFSSPQVDEQKHPHETLVSSPNQSDAVPPQPSPAFRDSTTELLQPLIEKRTCAWTYAWGLGEEVSNIALVYDDTMHYESTMPDDVRQALDDWCWKNQAKCQEKKRDTVGALVRLEKAQWSHRER